MGIHKNGDIPLSPSENLPLVGGGEIWQGPIYPSM